MNKAGVSRERNYALEMNPPVLACRGVLSKGVHTLLLYLVNLPAYTGAEFAEVCAGKATCVGLLTGG